MLFCHWFSLCSSSKRQAQGGFGARSPSRPGDLALRSAGGFLRSALGAARETSHRPQPGESSKWGATAVVGEGKQGGKVLLLVLVGGFVCIERLKMVVKGC